MKLPKLSLTLIICKWRSVISQTVSVILVFRTAAETAVMCCVNPACVGILWVVCSSIPTKLLQKLHHLACGLTSSFLTVFLDKLQSRVCICLLPFSFCKGCEFLYMFLNNRILITLKMLLEFVMQNTRHCMFFHSLNVNSCI